MLFSAFKQAHCTLVTYDSKWVTVVFYSMFFNIHPCGVFTLLQCYLAVTWLVPCETAAVSVHILCTPCNHTPVYSVTLFKAIYVECICMSSCNLPPALLAEWPGCFMHHCSNTERNRYCCKHQHRKLTLEAKICLPLFWGLRTATFQSWVWHSSHWAIHTPKL